MSNRAAIFIARYKAFSTAAEGFGFEMIYISIDSPHLGQ